MKAEYFPPKEDVILQNEAPTDFYILVTGTVVRNNLSLSLSPEKVREDIANKMKGVFRSNFHFSESFTPNENWIGILLQFYFLFGVGNKPIMCVWQG